ncbi:MAG: hypothetical protein ACHQ7M_09745 [Chloroflexota bacterium]
MTLSMAGLEQCLDLFQDKRVALDSGGVMRFLVLDICPDALRLLGRWEAAETRAQLFDLGRQPLVDNGPRGAATLGRGSQNLLRYG